VRTVLQRVARAEVRADGEVVGAIPRGLVLLVGVAKGDTEDDAAATARKVAALRVFPGRTPMDLSVAEVGGAVLVVSQFTTVGALSKGNRPGFDAAETPERAEALYLRVAEALRATGLIVRTGRFGANMELELVNDGPVTFILEARAGRIT
jgi:D-tyrosyl-tRNA(Tyr) deacylase